MELQNAVSSLTALAHTGRLQLFRELVQAGPKGIAAGELAARVDRNFTTVSAQLAVLAGAGLAIGERDGRSVIYRAHYPAMTGLLRFLVADCCRGDPQILGPLSELAGAPCCSPNPEGETS
jgi:DNA-binding transcriptional ArsR family regulator